MEILRLGAIVILGLFLANTATAQTSVIGGSIKLAYSDNPFSEKNFKKSFGTGLKATTNWRVEDHFGKEAIIANIDIVNSSSTAKFFSYNVAFFDKDNTLIGASNYNEASPKGMAPGKQYYLGSCIIYLPKNRYKDVESYKAVLYEDVAK